MKRFLTIIDRIVVLSGKTCSVLTLLVALAIVYEIVLRYLFNRPTPWVSESSAFGCAVVYVIGGAWTSHAGRHVRIELLYGRFSARGQAIADLIGFVFFALYMGMMLWASVRYAWESVELRETAGTLWDPPVYPIKIALVLGIVLLLMQGVAKFIRDLNLVLRSKPA